MEEVGVRFPPGPPDRKLQARGSRLASLGDQIVRFSGRKNQLAILHFGKRKFLKHINYRKFSRLSELKKWVTNNMREFSESASSAWDKLSAEAKEAHTKQIKGYADSIMGGVSNEWTNLGRWKIPAMGELPSSMLFRELESRGCELRQGTGDTSWEVRKKSEEK